MRERLDETAKCRNSGEPVDITSLNFLRKSAHLSTIWQINERLETEEPPDRALSGSYLAQRIIRTSIYESSWMAVTAGNICCSQESIFVAFCAIK